MYCGAQNQGYGDWHFLTYFPFSCFYMLLGELAKASQDNTKEVIVVPDAYTQSNRNTLAIKSSTVSYLVCFFYSSDSTNLL